MCDFRGHLRTGRQAGRYALITELLPARSHVTGNAVLTTLTEFATIVGPAIADLPALLAANGTVTVVALPLGTLLGGPLVAALGPQHAIAVCAAAMIVAGMAALPLAYRRDLRADGTARP